MKDSTKSKLKLAGSIAGAVGGSCAASFVCGAIAAVNPVIGIPMAIGKFVFSSFIAERCAEHVINTTSAIIDNYEETKGTAKEIIDKVKEEYASKEDNTDECFES